MSDFQKRRGIVGNSIAHGLKKVKASHTRCRTLGPELTPVYRQSASRWLYVIHPAVGCHYFLTFRQACGYLPSRRAPPIGWYQVILLWWQRHIGVNNLPKVVTQLLLRLGIEPTTCWSQVQRSTRCAPRHLHTDYSGLNSHILSTLCACRVNWWLCVKWRRGVVVASLV